MIPASAREIDEAAAEWAIRREQRQDDPGFAADLERWLAGDPRRAGALLRAEATLSFLGETGPVAVRGADQGLTRRRWLIASGASAAAVVAGLVGWRWRSPGATTLTTRLGEVSRRRLADGSVATISTDSAIAVALERRQRRVTLAKGEAWFQVAKDPARPFVVTAGQVRVRAVGTAFSVRLRPDGADVLVTEGVVEVWRQGQEDRRVRVAKGQRAQALEGRATAVAEAGETIDKDLAWRAGEIALYGQTVSQAAATFNRFNARKIVVAGPSLGQEKIVGQFSATDPDGFARAAAGMLGARVRAQDDEIVLERLER